MSDQIQTVESMQYYEAAAPDTCFTCAEPIYACGCLASERQWVDGDFFEYFEGSDAELFHRNALLEDIPID